MAIRKTKGEEPQHETPTEVIEQHFGQTKKQEVEHAHVPEAVPELANRRQFTDDDMREIKTFEDAQRMAAEKFGEVLNYSEEFGTGFTLLDDKDRIVGKDMFILEWQINKGTWGEFASFAVITESNEKYIINDGSSGIYAQLAELSYSHNKSGGLFITGGLRKSTYDTCLECGVPRPPEIVCTRCGDTTDRRAEGTTYYLSK